MKEINEIFNMLNSNNDLKVQQEGIKLASNIDNIEHFIQPSLYGKCVWENCAKVLSLKDDDILKPYLFDLLVWLQDLNWPGAIIILERLKRFTDFIFLADVISAVVNSAKASNDFIWIANINLLLDNDKLRIIMKKNYIKTFELLNENNIDEIISMLDSRKSLDVQQKGIKCANNLGDISSFIMPLDNEYTRNTWKNCAVIICSKSDEELNAYLIEILEWLRSSSYPGYNDIINRLLNYVYVDKLAFAIDICVKKALAFNFNEWLINMKKLLDNDDLRKILSIDYYEIFEILNNVK